MSDGARRAPERGEAQRFWALADRLAATSRLVIDRPRGTTHPRLPDVVYPLDYGYLAGTGAVDGGGVDAWRGTLPTRRVTGAIVTVDVTKRADVHDDAEYVAPER